VNITLTAVSPGGFSLTYTVVSPPTHGALSGVAPNLTYTATTGYVGPDSFTFKANDGTGDSNVATVSITDLPPDTPPVASNGTATIPAGTTGAITLAANDPDGDPLTYAIVAPPAHGQVSGGTGPNRTYTPAAGYSGTDAFTFKANDGTYDSNVATVTITIPAQPPPAPSVVSSQGYINVSGVTTNTTAPFNTSGASTLVAFVTSFPSWNGLPVSLNGITDNVGNSWHVLAGPTTYANPSGTYPTMSATYYVNAPVTSATHTVTATLTNGAPLLLHVFAVSGSNITGPPIYAPITDPGANPTAVVTSQPVAAPANSLLLGWVHNESGGTSATATSGFTLDGQSLDYLWAESQQVSSAGNYSASFLLTIPMGWQTSVVAVRQGSSVPVAYSQSLSTRHTVNITLTAVSPGGFPLTYTVVSPPTHGALSGLAPNLTYTATTGYVGPDSFTF
jgi:hypothetical protein